jgi:hypothetical protein
MSMMIMNMSGFEIERNDSVAEEVVYTAPVTALQRYTERENRMPVDMLAVDAELFLQKMYTYQY